MINTMQLL